MMTTVGFNGYGTFLIYGTFCFSMFFFVWFLVPETKVRRIHLLSCTRVLTNTLINRVWLLRRWTSSSVLLS